MEFDEIIKEDDFLKAVSDAFTNKTSQKELNKEMSDYVNQLIRQITLDKKLSNINKFKIKLALKRAIAVNDQIEKLNNK